MGEHLKTCFKCSEPKPMTEFYKHPAMSDGVLGKCKDCTKRDVRRQRLTNPELIRAYDRKRNSDPERMRKRTERNYKYRQDNPVKRAAHSAVGNALRDGKLTRLPCAFCGAEDNLEAHHPDYAKPLDVTWLCRPCHRRYHALETRSKFAEIPA